MASFELTETKKGLYCRLDVRVKKPDGTFGHYRQRWEIPQGLTKRQIEKAAQRAADDLEEKMKDGFKVDNKQTFHDYALLVIERRKSVNQLGDSTEASYLDFLKRIDDAFGKMPIADIRAFHIEQFYLSLKKDGARKANVKALPRRNFIDVMRKSGMTTDKIVETANVSKHIIESSRNGRVIMYDKAVAVAKALNVPFERIYEKKVDTTPLSNKTALEYYNFIRLVLRSAVRDKLITYNYADDVLHDKKKQETPNYFQPESRDSILDAVDAYEGKDKYTTSKYRLLIYLYTTTGCRRGEIAGLQWSKIDFDNSIIEISATLNYNSKNGTWLKQSTKTDKFRFIKIEPELADMLKEHRALQKEYRVKNADIWDEQNYVFTQNDGRPINPTSITAWCNRFSKRTGLQHINPHAFRHTAASTMIADGIDIVTVAGVLGHAQVSTTVNIYAHQIAKAKAAASKTLFDVAFKRRKKA